MPNTDFLVDEFQEMAESGRYAEILERLRILTGYDQLSTIYWSLFAYENLGQSENGVEYYKINELVIKNDNREELKTKIWNTVGNLYYKCGKPLIAYEFFQKAFQSAITLNQQDDLLTALNSLGTVNVTRGDLNKGLEFYEKCLANAINQNDLILQTKTLYNIGTIYFFRCEFDKARDYYLKALKIRRKLGNETRISMILRSLVELEFSTKHPDLGEVESYLDELRENANQKNTNLTNLYYLSSKAFYCKFNGDLNKSEMILKSIIENNQEIDTTVSAILNLIEIFFIRYKNNPRDKILKKIHYFLDKMFDISKEQFSFRYLVKSLILKSQISAIEGDFDESYLLIEKALKSTEDHDMDYLRNEILTIKDQLVREYNRLEELFAQDSSVLSRLESSSIMEYLKESRNI